MVEVCRILRLFENASKKYKQRPLFHLHVGVKTTSDETKYKIVKTRERKSKKKKIINKKQLPAVGLSVTAFLRKL